MNEKRVVVKNTISSKGFAAEMERIRCAANGGRVKKFDLETKLEEVGIPEVVIMVMASEGFEKSRIPSAVKKWVEG